MTTVFVGNLSFSTTESELRNLFERFGHVSSVRIAKEKGSNAPRGFAFVNMPCVDDAEEAIARLNGQQLGGRSIAVNEARDRDDERLSAARAPRRSALLDLL